MSMGFFEKLLGVPAAASNPVADAQVEELSRLAAHKANALELARQTAEKENRAPTLTDYFRAALTIPELEGKASTIADLSGHRIDGLTIRHEDIYPTPEQQQSNMADAKGPAVEPGIGALRNFFDADGNGTIEPVEISNFYKEVQSTLRFDGTQFLNVTFQPATTLEIFNRANGAQFANITLDGLGEGETLTIGTMETGGGKAREVFSNVRVRNDDGGTIEVAANATLNGLMVEGGNTVLNVKPGAQVNQIVVKGEEISLNVQPKGQLFLPSFEAATFNPDSSMKGAILRGNTMDDRFYGFKDSTLNGMSFDQASLSGITFDNTNLSGVSFKGTRLADCVIKDTDLANVDFSGATLHNLTIERGGQRTRIDNLEQLQQYQSAEGSIKMAEDIGRGLGASIASIGKSAANQLSASPDSRGSHVTQSAGMLSGQVLHTGPTTIAFGGDTGCLTETLDVARNDNKGVPITEQALAARVDEIMARHVKC